MPMDWKDARHLGGCKAELRREKSGLHSARLSGLEWQTISRPAREEVTSDAAVPL
jgi:hypothetical protein